MENKELSELVTTLNTVLPGLLKHNDHKIDELVSKLTELTGLFSAHLQNDHDYQDVQLVAINALSAKLDTLIKALISLTSLLEDN
jgi:hypothetical protein